MSDEAQHEPKQEDPIKNLKSEYERKFGNIESKLDESTKKFDQYFAELKSALQPKQVEPKTDLEDMMYSDPEGYARAIEERAYNRIKKDYESIQATERRQTEVLNEIIQDYPEINQPGSQLKKAVEEAYLKLPKEKQADPAYWQAIVHRTAAAKGLKPYAARSADEQESFTFGGSSAGRGKSRDDRLPESTIEFAKMMGLDVNDKKIVESLTKTSKRNWLVPTEVE